ncbi:MAG TPA: S-layer protein domain-containing protein, partial [Methanothrix sp.]|nr:S-layer protein domain-containing protein [Methanothrix sp.]
MTKVTAITLTALVLLLASAITVSAVDMVEIRGPVATVENGAYTWGPQEFAGFYYDIDDDIGTESITLTITDGDILDEPNGIVYNTVAQPDDFDFDEWGQYMTIGFLA